MTTRFAALVLVFCLISGVSFGQAPKKTPPTNWEMVKSLRGDQAIRVVLRDRQQVDGWFRWADDEGLRISIPAGRQTTVGTYREIRREDVAQLWKIHIRQKPIPRGRLMLDSALGLAAGIGVGAIVDSQHPNGGEAAGKLSFGILGVVVGPLVDVVAGSSIFHRPKLVYESPQPKS